MWWVASVFAAAALASPPQDPPRSPARELASGASQQQALRALPVDRDAEQQGAPIKEMTLEEALEFINADELVEITPSAVRIRKRILDHSDRKRLEKRAET